MRMKIDQAPTFPLLIDDGELKIVREYQNKYDSISAVLDSNPSILDAVHEVGSRRRPQLHLQQRTIPSDHTGEMDGRVEFPRYHRADHRQQGLAQFHPALFGRCNELHYA